MNELTSGPSSAAEAAQWDDSADERERLADERERLADEREQLAEERERLADHEERSADRWIADVDESAESARAQLLRAEARVQRALAEQERARAAVERVSLHEERTHSSVEREGATIAASGLEADELTWAFERRAFVATERAHLAEVRDAAADSRDDQAGQREHEADGREGVARRREELAAQRDADATGAAARLDKATDRAQRDLDAVRGAGRRQRAAAVATRRRAASDRAEAGRRREEAGTGPEPYGRFLLAQFTALTNELFVSRDLFAVAERVADLTLECIPGAVATGVTFFEGVRPMAHVTTDDIAEQLCAYQLARDEGPICESLERGGPVSIGDLASDERWPSLRSMADMLGVRGVAACGLTVQRGQRWQPLGALTVYADRPDAFDDDTADEVSLFAAHLALVTAFDWDRHDVSRREAALHRALGSRDIIGQAKGVLMERQHILAGDAFDMLKRTSQRLNIRLQDLATRVAETGELPE